MANPSRLEPDPDSGSGRLEVRVFGGTQGGTGPLKLRPRRSLTFCSDPTLRWRRVRKCETLGEGRSCQVCKSETPQGQRATQAPGGTERWTHLPGCVGRQGAGRERGVGAPLPLALHSVHSFALGGSSPPKPRGVSDPGRQRAAPFPASALGPLPPVPPPPDTLPLKERRWGRRRGGKLSPPPLPKSTTLLRADRPGFPP